MFYSILMFVAIVVVLTGIIYGGMSLYFWTMDRWGRGRYCKVDTRDKCIHGISGARIVPPGVQRSPDCHLCSIFTWSVK